MTRTPWANRDKEALQPYQKPGDVFTKINRALAENVPATLTTKEIMVITGYSHYHIRASIEAGEFPPAMNQGSRSWKKWASADIKAWLVENGLPTVFGKKEAADA